MVQIRFPKGLEAGQTTMMMKRCWMQRRKEEQKRRRRGRGVGAAGAVYSRLQRSR